MAIQEGKLAERLAELERALPSAGARLEAWLRDAPDLEVFRACPLRWAEAQGLDPGDAVAMLLHATRARLLQLHWELACPGCGLLIDSVERLGAVHDDFFCEVCNNVRDIALDDWIHVTFGVRPEVRRVPYHDREALQLRERLLGCEVSLGVVMRDGEPLRRFLDRQFSLIDLVEPGGTREARFELSPGILIACPSRVVPIRGEAVDSTVDLDLEIDAQGKLCGLPNELRPGYASVRVRSTAPDVRRLWFFQSADGYRFGPPRGYTASRLIHHPAYALLFPSQLACAGTMTIREITLLFSDLVRSTAMYRELGDLRAYERVREHFAVLAPVVAAHHGLWVKDIGDAVMASFPDPADAVLAAIDMHRAVRELGGLELKVGLHRGSCIGVTYRGQLDWFGSTVNLAARIQTLAGPGELCMSSAVYDRLEVPLRELAEESFDAHVRGIDAPIRVHRRRTRPDE